MPPAETGRAGALWYSSVLHFTKANKAPEGTEYGPTPKVQSVVKDLPHDTRAVLAESAAPKLYALSVVKQHVADPVCKYLSSCRTGLPSEPLVLPGVGFAVYAVLAQRSQEATYRAAVREWSSDFVNAEALLDAVGAWGPQRGTCRHWCEADKAGVPFVLMFRLETGLCTCGPA